MFEQLITVSIWKFVELSDEIHSISAARFGLIICDKTLKCDSQVNVIDNILLSKLSVIEAVFHSVNFCQWRFLC